MRIRYGLVWLFPGDPELASQRQIPDIPQLEGPDRWACVSISFACSAHHSMIIDNVSDFFHAYLRRQYRSFDVADLSHVETRGDEVHLAPTAPGPGLMREQNRWVMSSIGMLLPLRSIHWSAFSDGLPCANGLNIWPARPR